MAGAIHAYSQHNNPLGRISRQEPSEPKVTRENQLSAIESEMKVHLLLAAKGFENSLRVVDHLVVNINNPAEKKEVLENVLTFFNTKYILPETKLALTKIINTSIAHVSEGNLFEQGYKRNMLEILSKVEVSIPDHSEEATSIEPEKSEVLTPKKETARVVETKLDEYIEKRSKLAEAFGLERFLEVKREALELGYKTSDMFISFLERTLYQDTKHQVHEISRSITTDGFVKKEAEETRAELARAETFKVQEDHRKVERSKSKGERVLSDTTVNEAKENPFLGRLNDYKEQLGVARYREAIQEATQKGLNTTKHLFGFLASKVAEYASSAGSIVTYASTAEEAKLESVLSPLPTSKSLKDDEALASPTTDQSRIDADRTEKEALDREALEAAERARLADAEKARLAREAKKREDAALAKVAAEQRRRAAEDVKVSDTRSSVAVSVAERAVSGSSSIVLPTTGDVKGLVNEGNQCYFNTALQVLIHTPKFIQHLESKVALAERLVREVTAINRSVAPEDRIREPNVRPYKEDAEPAYNEARNTDLHNRDLFNNISGLKKLLALVNEYKGANRPSQIAKLRQGVKDTLFRTMFSRRGQEDSAEVITRIQDVLQFGIAKVTSKITSTIEPALTSSIVEVYGKFELPLIEDASGKFNIQTSLDGFFNQEEVTEPGNYYRFTKTETDGSVSEVAHPFKKETTLSSASENLFVTFKRFSYGAQGARRLDFKIDVPTDGIVVVNGARYKIVATGEHMGGASGGHYTASVITNDKSVAISDTSVRNGSVRPENLYYASLVRV